MKYKKQALTTSPGFVRAVSSFPSIETRHHPARTPLRAASEPGATAATTGPPSTSSIPSEAHASSSCVFLKRIQSEEEEEEEWTSNQLF